MNNLFSYKKFLMRILTLLMLLSIVGPAMAKENKVEMPNSLLRWQGRRFTLHIPTGGFRRRAWIVRVSQAHVGRCCGCLCLCRSVGLGSFPGRIAA